MNDIKVFFKRLHEDSVIPTYGTPGSAGCDLYTIEEFDIEPGEIKLVHCGFSMEFGHGIEAQIRPRSGLAIKKGITVVNSPGTIDEDYRNEIMVGLINLGKNTVTIERHDRIAQMVFAPVYKGHFIETTNDLTSTVRGLGGFGSTGR
jgi:dUTP pyrophosphatase